MKETWVKSDYLFFIPNDDIRRVRVTFTDGVTRSGTCTSRWELMI